MRLTHQAIGGNILAVIVGLSLASFEVRANNGTIVIQSGDVERLYAVTDNPANANKTVILRPGTYALSTATPSGATRPRGGALMLQEGMKLLGSNTYADLDHDGVWDASFDGNPVIAGETVLDARSIGPLQQEVGPNGQPEADCTGFSESQTSGAAVKYRDRSTISGVTILAGFGVLAIGPPHSAYLPSKGHAAEISNNFLDNGTFSAPGAGFGNLGCRMRNASSTLLFQGNIVRGNYFGLAVINGLTNQAGDKRIGPSLNAVLLANHFLGNITGMHSRNTLGTDGGWINIHSADNLYEGSFWGLEVTAGTDYVASSGANGNQLNLLSSGDTFRQNEVGVIGAGVWRFNPDPSLSSFAGNDLRLILLNDSFEGGQALHAWSIFPEPRAGTDKNNRVTAYVRGSTSGTDPVPPFLFLDTVPGDSNTVSIVGTNAAFESSNGTAPTYLQYLVPPNAFDLADTALHFTPGATDYSVTAASAAIDTDFGPALDFTGEPNGPFPVDDDSAEVLLPFAFNFEGQSYTSVFVNTDGTLTFGLPDFASAPHDINRFISGPPRIAALSADLAPNIAGRVHANVFADKVVITWVEVPSWVTGLSDANTFQIVLHGSGAIDLVYGAIGTPDGIVGITPGGLGTVPDAIDLSEAAGGTVGLTLYEGFFGIVGP